MVEVRFEPGGKFVLVAAGTTLLAASRAAGLDLAFGCTRGRCGTDAVRCSPPSALEPPGVDEKATLERMGLEPEFRLSCSARVRDGAGPVCVEIDRF